MYRITLIILPSNSKIHWLLTCVRLARLFGWRHDQMPKVFWPSGNTIDMSHGSLPGRHLEEAVENNSQLIL